MKMHFEPQKAYFKKIPKTQLCCLFFKNIIYGTLQQRLTWSIFTSHKK